MFVVNETYRNRKGQYQVLSIDPPHMTVRYDDGTIAELNMAIQARIWENIQSEEEARAASRMARRRRSTLDTHFYVKSLSMVAEEDLSVPGWRERILVVTKGGPEMQVGDRVLFYAIEDQVFFALATVSGPATETVPKGFFYSEEEAESMTFYPIDLDEHTYNLENAVDLDTADLENTAEYRRRLQRPNVYLSIDEDDFELIAELLSEITEEEEEEYDDEEEEEEDYEE